MSGGRDRPDPEMKAGWIVPSILGATLLMYSFNATALFNALPAMARDLNEDLLHMNLLATMFMLAATVVMPLSGWMADRFGARPMLEAAVVVFALASIGCGLAQDMPQMLLARVLQGLAGGTLIPICRLILLRTTPKHDVIAALAILTLPAMVGPMLGPLIGGFLVTYADWRWIFYVNLPIALAALVLARAHVPDVRGAEAASPMDWVGVVLTAVGLSCLIFAVSSLSDRSVSGPVVTTLFLVAALCLGLYWPHARRHADPIVDLTLFRLRTFRIAVLDGSVVRLGMQAAPFLWTMLLQVCLGVSAFVAGFLTFMAAAGSLVSRSLAPMLLRRFGFRTVLLTVLAAGGATFTVCATFSRTTPLWLIGVVLAISGVFQALLFSILNGLGFAELEQSQMSGGSATSAMAAQLGQAISVGLTAALLQTAMRLLGHSALSLDIVRPAFIILALLVWSGIPSIARLPPTVGATMHTRPGA